MKLFSITKSLLAIALLSVLAGCFTLGSDYTPKKWDGPEAWMCEAPATSPLPDGAPWWTVFNDPVLNELEEKLVAQNPSLAAAVARLDAAAAQIGIARASYAPSLDGSASVQYDRQTGEVRSSTKIANNPTWLPTRSLKTAASRR